MYILLSDSISAKKYRKVYFYNNKYILTINYRNYRNMIFELMYTALGIKISPGKTLWEIVWQKFGGVAGWSPIYVQFTSKIVTTKAKKAKKERGFFS
jgi:hypothetical protein